mmetsp:Transcript_7177/g.11277  ORF Transcript_7177/g.11277 Transcript_7177/m.11277 type:complete len:122 (+) Transcript_7177:326-691(+)
MIMEEMIGVGGIDPPGEMTEEMMIGEIDHYPGEISMATTTAEEDQGETLMMIEEEDLPEETELSKMTGEKQDIAGANSSLKNACNNLCNLITSSSTKVAIQNYIHYDTPPLVATDPFSISQ